MDNVEYVDEEEQILLERLLASSKARSVAEAKFNLANHDYIVARDSVTHYKERQRLIAKIGG